MSALRVFSIIILLMALSVSITYATSTEDCKECHLEKYEAWKTSAHHDSDEAVIDRPGVETCIPCHTASTPRLYSI